MRHFEGELRFDTGYAAPGLLTAATANGRAAGVRLAAVTVADESETGTEWAHFVGDISASGTGFTAQRRDVELSFAASARSLEAVRASLVSDDDASEVDCGVSRFVLREQPTVLKCPQLAELEWDVGAEPRLLAVTDEETGERRLMMSTESDRLALGSGSHLATAVPLSTEAGELGVAYVVTQPRVSPIGGSAPTAGWPTEEFEIRDRVSSEAEQFVRLQLDRFASVTLSFDGPRIGRRPVPQ